MRIQLPQYSGKDDFVMVLVTPVFSCFINFAIFGRSYISSWAIFVPATIITCTAGFLDFILCGYIAVKCKERYPHEYQLMKRLTLMILTFLVITGIYLFTLFRGYEIIPYFKYRFNEAGFIWSYFAMGIINIFLTFLQEGISRYNAWNNNLKETEALSKVYKQSQLNGLKSQVNPHFLFNSLNSLSSLIAEDEEAAEKFLNEMSKVYRYLLRTDEEQLVSLQTELTFVASYTHLLKARFGAAFEVKTQISEADEGKWLPPLTLQVIIENAFSQNTVSKSSPLTIEIESGMNDYIMIRNNVQPKIMTDIVDYESALDNLVNKYKLLNDAPVIIEEAISQRTIHLPLLYKKEEAVA